jgi:subtilase family protein
VNDRFREGTVTGEPLWYVGLEARAEAEAAIIVDAFREEGFEIGGVSDPATEDDDVTGNGIAFMYDTDHILTREQYLRGIAGVSAPRSFPDAKMPRGVLDILHDEGVEYVAVTRVVKDVVLLCFNPSHGKHPGKGDDTAREVGNKESSGPPGDEVGSSGGEGEGPVPGRPGAERPDVLRLLEIIDRELGVGAATPDHVLTAANGAMGPCSATEPEPVYPGSGPNPPICRGGGARVRIFVADTGLLDGAKALFPWLRGVWYEKDPRTHLNGIIAPYGGHGTFVTGVLRCVAPEAQIHVANIFNIAGSALESHFVYRLNEAFDFGFEILHLTASCMTRKNVQLIALEAWLELLDSYKGVVCVAPSGNNDTRRPSWPGAFPGVISVGALATDWRSRAYFSDYGGSVDVYAPGEKLINAFGNGTYTCMIPPNVNQGRTFSGLAQWSGTSFSAPVVTGLIAARMARRGESAREAAAALLAKARAQTIPGVGPVLFPGCEGEGERCGDERRGCHHCGGGDCECRRGCDCGCGRGCGGGCGCDGGCVRGLRRPLRDVIEAVTRAGWGFRDR